MRLYGRLSLVVVAASWRGACAQAPIKLSRRAQEDVVRCKLGAVRAEAQAVLKRGGTNVVVRVGAHLALSNYNDPFHSLDQDLVNKTVLVEPQVPIYRELVASLARATPRPGHQILAANRAIVAGDETTVSFYALDADRVDATTGCVRPACAKRLPPWATQIASLSKERLTSRLPFPQELRDFVEREGLVVETRVAASRMDRLFGDYDVDAARDLLVLSIDAEGYDGVLLRSVDFSAARPFLVLYENKHMGRGEYVEVQRLLRSHGYRCIALGENDWCVNRERARGAAACKRFLASRKHEV